MELVGDDDGPAVEVDEGDVIACELAHAEIDRDGALGRHVRVNVSNSSDDSSRKKQRIDNNSDDSSRKKQRVDRQSRSSRKAAKRQRR